MSGQRIELKTSLALAILLGILCAAPIAALAIVSAGKVGGLVICGACLAAFVWLCVRLAARRLILDAAGVTVKGAFSEKHSRGTTSSTTRTGRWSKTRRTRSVRKVD